MIGRAFSHYRITAALGVGGMGEVYRAVDTKLGREVALKMLRGNLAASPERLERFRREARVLAALDHPGIVTVHSVEEFEGVPFLTMQLVEGEPLGRLLSGAGMPVEQILSIAAALADALAAAHARGIIHRDLKPANVMVTAQGQVKVLDFGLAKVSDAFADPKLGSKLQTEIQTRDGIVLGTLPYMSPEQLSGSPVDARTDIFSLGAVLYEMAAGQRPFQGRTPAELASAILRDAPRPLRTVRADLPASLVALVERCLAKDRGGRPRSVREVCSVLEELRAVGVWSHSERSGAGSEPLNGNLPSAVDSFVAREAELAEILARLGESRLLTLVGAAGTGKTRLAIEAARRLAGGFTGGAWLAGLAPVPQGEAVPGVVADLVGAVPLLGKTVLESVVDSLRHRSLLLVLDNCEHVLDAAAELAVAITTQCDGVRILATSRESLAIRGEQVLPLQSLPDADGADLFRDRARAAGFRGELDSSTLGRLSRQLDGVPLAIELAAARCNALSPEQIEERLDDRFRLLRGSRRGRGERHQTLRNAVAWSYELLEPVERAVFDRLSAFAGGFTLEGARVVAAGGDIDADSVEDAVSALVARSMVVATNTGEGTRYRLLETLRQFGAEQVVSCGEVPLVRENHVRYFTDFMARAWDGLWSDSDAEWIRAVGSEYENLRVAVHTAIDGRDRVAIAKLLKPLFFWAWNSLRYEVADWAEAALLVSPEPAYARAVAVHLRFHGGRPDQAARLSVGLREQEDGDDADLDCLTAMSRWEGALVSPGCEWESWMLRTFEAGRRTGNQALATALESSRVAFELMAGAEDEARRTARECHETAKATGNRTALCWSHFFMGRAYADCDPERAVEHFDRAVEIGERQGILLVSGPAATEAAVVMARFEAPDRARARLSRALRSLVDSGDRWQLWTSAHHLALFLVREDRLDEARAIWRELGNRPGFAAKRHRDELTRLFGAAGEGTVSDDELVERVRGVLDTLVSEAP